jgi:3-phosphoshikimate 1-carboxyvinyltransferase
LIALKVPGDKSISHRALMLAPLANGTSRICGLSTGADVKATAAAMRALGVDAARVPDDDEPLEVTGPARLRSPDSLIDCGNSGTTARLLLGLIAGRAITATLDGDASLRRRPMARVIDPLRAVGATLRELGAPGRLPLEIKGGTLRGLEHQSPVASAQVKSALLLAGLAAGVPVTVYEPGPSRDHTELMLRAMGATIESERLPAGYVVFFEPPRSPLAPLDLTVPGDFSSAAYWIALAVLGGAQEGLRLDGVGLNPRRTGFLKALEAMGADINVTVSGEEAGEPVGEIVARPSSLSGIEVPPEWMPTLIDEVPILACVAALAEGVTEITGATELRVKESDRLATLQSNLARLGVKSTERADGLRIEGPSGPLSGRIETAGDHRMAMAFGVLGALQDNDVEIDERASAAVSYPAFWDELSQVAHKGEA